MEDGQQFCAYCGHPVEAKMAVPQTGNVGDSIVGKLNEYVGNTQSADLNWRVLFSDVIKHHTKEEAENIFICGTPMTTPHINDVSKDWPHPWLYSRVLGMFLLAFFLLWICCSVFDNTNALPGLIVVGSFAVPIATMIMFMEVNVFRDVSLYTIARIFLVGGCASLVAALLLFSVIEPGELDYFGAIMVGIIEEVGKAVIVCYFLKKMERFTVLGGLLVGASVGAGFAAFESAGYAMQPLMLFFRQAGYFSAYGQVMDTSQMLDSVYNVIFLRGFLAPGTHVAWAAISGAALVLASKSKPLTYGTMITSDFLRLFFIPVVLHALWDCPLASTLGQGLYISYIALCLMVWVVILILINMGLAEVSNNKQQSTHTYK